VAGKSCPREDLKAAIASACCFSNSSMFSCTGTGALPPVVMVRKTSDERLGEGDAECLQVVASEVRGSCDTLVRMEYNGQTLPLLLSSIESLPPWRQAA
jgi:hypothetical protein